MIKIKWKDLSREIEMIESSNRNFRIEQHNGQKFLIHQIGSKAEWKTGQKKQKFEGSSKKNWNQKKQKVPRPSVSYNTHVTIVQEAKERENGVENIKRIMSLI